jgi:hypothetical protein
LTTEGRSSKEDERLRRSEGCSLNKISRKTKMKEDVCEVLRLRMRLTKVLKMSMTEGETTFLMR